MRATSSPAGAVIACAVGGLFVVLASGREWAHTTLHSPQLGGVTSLKVTGHAVAPALPALGVALLALSAAILAASGLMRRLVGVVIILVAVCTVVVSVAARGRVSTALMHHEVGAQGLAVHATANLWWLLATVGGVLGLVAGVLTVVGAGKWAAMSAKYDAPSAPKPTKDPAAVAWDALDRGEDPTA